MKRNELCADILFDYVQKFVPVPRACFEEILDEWVLTPVTLCGETVGAIMVKGNEIHIAVKPGAHGFWVSRRYLPLLLNIISVHGCAVTSVRPDNLRSIEFVERLGFYRTGANEHFVNYRRDHAN